MPAYSPRRLHFDQYDNFYLQLAGTKTFRLFDPAQSGRLAPYPVHHRMDRSAQDKLYLAISPPCLTHLSPTSHPYLTAWTASAQALPPRCDDARGVEVTLQPGELMYAPSRD